MDLFSVRSFEFAPYSSENSAEVNGLHQCTVYHQHGWLDLIIIFSTRCAGSLSYFSESNSTIHCTTIHSKIYGLDKLRVK